MSKVLIQFAHPTMSRSSVQKTLESYGRKVKGVTFNDLYENYPDLYIDIKREQQLLTDHDVVIFQHPFYWYSSPAVLKQWQDLVLEYNWAYGPEGKALAGKRMLNAISCGGGREAYRESGYNRFPVTQFLLPFDQTAHLCKMEYLPPFVIHETFNLNEEKLRACGELYARLLTALVQDTIRVEDYQAVEYLNELVVEHHIIRK